MSAQKSATNAGEEKKTPRKKPVDDGSGLSNDAWAVLEDMTHHGATLSGVRTFPHPYKFTLFRCATPKRSSSTRTVALTLVDSLVQAGVIVAPKPANDVLFFIVTDKAAVVLARHAVVPALGKQLDAFPNPVSLGGVASTPAASVSAPRGSSPPTGADTGEDR